MTGADLHNNWLRPSRWRSCDDPRRSPRVRLMLIESDDTEALYVSVGGIVYRHEQQPVGDGSEWVEKWFRLIPQVSDANFTGPDVLDRPGG